MIKALTCIVPEQTIDRSKYEQTKLKQFEKATGILKTRRWDTSLIEKVVSGLKHHDNLENIGAVIYITQSPERLSPCMAMNIHQALGLRKYVPAVDINHACDGWVFGLWMSSAFATKTLLVCADKLRYSNPDNPLEELIFSDSITISTTDFHYQKYAEFYTDGSNADKLYCGLNGEMKMDGSAVFDFVTSKIPPMIKSMKQHQDFDWLIPHQANKVMNKILELRAGCENKALYSIEEYGNCSMNSIPITIAMNEEKCLDKHLLLCGFGAGLSAAAMRVIWSDKRNAKIVEMA